MTKILVTKKKKERITKIKNPEKPREWPKWPCGGSVIPRYGCIKTRRQSVYFVLPYQMLV